MTNCLYASMIHRIETVCNCSPFFATMSNTEAGSVEQRPTCVGEGLVCKEAVMINWGDPELGLNRVLNTKTGRITECLPACDVQNFDLSITSSLYPSSSRVFSEKKDLCFVVSKIGRICQVRCTVRFCPSSSSEGQVQSQGL